MEVSLLTSSCTLVPTSFFEPSRARDILAEVAVLNEQDEVKYKEIPQYGAVLVYAGAADCALPEMYHVLNSLQDCPEYNKILCSWKDGLLFLAIAQGRSLLLANVFEAPDFTTAQYYIFLAMKSLQLNPEVSTICLRESPGSANEMSLYRYFKAVEVI